MEPQSTSQQPVTSQQAAPKTKMLAWWAIIPTLLWGVAAWQYIWPLAALHASAPKYAPSYFMGQLIAAPLLGLILGWLAFRALRRSQLAASIAYTLVCVAMALNQFQKYRVDAAVIQPGAAQAGTGGASLESFPVYGVTLQSPPSWQPLEADRLSIIARWASPNSTTGDVRGLIMAEVMKPDMTDGKRIAEQYAKQWNGKVVEDTITLGGEKAWEIQAQPSSDKLQPTVGVLCLHEGRLYFINAGVAHGQTCQEQVDFIRKSWKWIPTEPPADHLAFREQPFVALNGQVTVNAPTIMRPFAGADPQHSFGLECFDFKAESRAMNLVVTLGDFPAGMTLAGAQQRLSAGIQQQYHLPEAFTWRKLPDSHGFEITQPVPGPTADGSNWIMWAVAGSGQNKFVLVNVGLYARDPAQRAKYVEAALRNQVAHAQSNGDSRE